MAVTTSASLAPTFPSSAYGVRTVGHGHIHQLKIVFVENGWEETVSGRIDLTGIVLERTNER